MENNPQNGFVTYRDRMIDTLPTGGMYTDKIRKLRYLDISAWESPVNEAYSVVSLFSGAGGFDIGLEQAGFQTLICIENDANCRATLKHNRPEWRTFERSEKQLPDGTRVNRMPGDIRMIDADEVLEAIGKKKGAVDLIAGGAPCQPFSNIGKKLGDQDGQNGDLFLAFVRMVNGIEPRAFIFENVAGIVQNKHNAVLQYMYDRFKGSGYGLSYALLNAADYGVPQRRERFLLIGIKGIDQPAFPLPTHTKDLKVWENFVQGFDTIPTKRPLQWKTVQETLAALPIDYRFRKDDALMNISERVVDRMKYIPQGKNFKVLPVDLRPNCWKTGKHQGNDTFGRLQADSPSVTIRTAAYNPSKGKYIHPYENRGLSTLEMAALQDFPYEWEFRTAHSDKLTLVSGGKQIGNAVPPGLAAALGKALMLQLRSQAR